MKEKDYLIGKLSLFLFHVIYIINLTVKEPNIFPGADADADSDAIAHPQKIAVSLVSS